jgi:hypothetical protein
MLVPPPPFRLKPLWTGAAVVVAGATLSVVGVTSGVWTVVGDGAGLSPVVIVAETGSELVGLATGAAVAARPIVEPGPAAPVEVQAISRKATSVIIVNPVLRFPCAWFGFISGFTSSNPLHIYYRFS